MTGHINWNALSAEQRADEETYYHDIPAVTPTPAYAGYMNLKAAQTGIVLGNQGNVGQVAAVGRPYTVAPPVATQIENPFGTPGRQPGEMYGGVKTYPPETHEQHEFDGQEPEPEEDEPSLFGLTLPDLSLPGFGGGELPGPLKFVLPWANPGVLKGDVPKLNLPDVTAPFDAIGGMMPMMLLMMFMKD